LRDEVAKVDAARSGERNEILNKAAFSLGQLVGASHLDEDVVVEWLYDAAVSNGLVEDDGPGAAMATIQSGLRGGSEHPREIPERNRSAAEDESAWRNPDLTLLGTNRRPAPAFPIEVLGPFWSEWGTRAAAAASAPVDYTACALLAAIGAAIANVRWPVAGSGWSEPPILWLGMVGSPSSGKSPAMDMVSSLVEHVETIMASDFENVQREFQTRKYMVEARLDEWKAQLKQHAKNPDGPPPSRPPETDEPEAPVRPRIRVADATIESLAALAAALPRGLLLAREELAGWLGNFDRYGGNGSDRAFFLEAYGGRCFRVDRVKRPDPINVRHLSIGVMGSIQPDRIAAVTCGPDDGLASRFLWTWPDIPATFRLAREPWDDSDACRAFARLNTLSVCPKSS
jgi:hypothetical protein